MPLTKSIKDHIEKLICPNHDIHPVVDLDWEGLKISACCQEFELECLKEAEKLTNNSHPVKLIS